MKNAGLMILLAMMLTSFSEKDLETVRTNYNKAESDEDICNNMISLLEKSMHYSAVCLGYLGGYQAISANHLFNPVNKLKIFNEGKNNIESAIMKEPGNVELRFIRLSIQTNAPSLLGYYANIEEDKNYLKNNKQQINSAILNQNIESLLNKIK